MISRRQFLKKCRDISLLLCGSLACSRGIAQGFIHLAEKPQQLAFVQGQNCLGCTTSLTYGNECDFIDFIRQIVRLQVHPALSFAQGSGYLEELEATAAGGDFILVVEGSVPAGIKQACYLGDRPLYDALAVHAARARLVVSAGTCSSHGGIPGSGANPTGALSVANYLKERQVSVPLVKIPGCPVHPDHLMGTLAYLTATGKTPPLENDAPRSYFGETIHDHCGRFQYFSQDLYLLDYAKDKDSCLLKKGCRGPLTRSDCPTRRWNGKTSVCIESNTPCIGCMNPAWPFDEAIYPEASALEDLPWSAMKKRTQEGS